MSWDPCTGGTKLFDDVFSAIINESLMNRRIILSNLIVALEQMQWDCHCDSAYIDDPLVQELFDIDCEGR